MPLPSVIPARLWFQRVRIVFQFHPKRFSGAGNRNNKTKGENPSTSLLSKENKTKKLPEQAGCICLQIWTSSVRGLLSHQLRKWVLYLQRMASNIVVSSPVHTQREVLRVSRLFFPCVESSQLGWFVYRYVFSPWPQSSEREKKKKGLAFKLVDPPHVC